MDRRTLHWLYWFSVMLAIALVAYQIYLNFFEKDFTAEHTIQIEKIESTLKDRESYRFAVLGNINNSVGIFERKIIPLLNKEKYDFVVSAGNAVSNGGEDKYRAIYRTLSRLNMPYLLAFGPQEESRIGGFRFYDHFGPYHFSFKAGNSRFIFLDSTGTTDFGWQRRWLNKELNSTQEPNSFVFSAHPFYPVDKAGLFGLTDEYLLADDEERTRIAALIEQFGVDAVFSTNLPQFDRQTHNGTHYIITGGAGGLIIDNDRSHHHFVSVDVEGDQITIEQRQLNIAQPPFWRTLESFWFFVHSLFYVGYLNFILLVTIVVAIAIWLRNRIFTEQDYYPNFDMDPDALKNARLRIAMFTNNYLPFIGGVPISIERLRQGLLQQRHKVLVVAPAYPTANKTKHGILRVRTLIPFGKGKSFRLANIFSPALYKQVLRFKPNIIHVHHPFWLGSVGLFIGRRLNIPVIYTYHTRLEHYAHYVPLPSALFRNLASHAIVRRFANRCDGVIVPTESAEEYLRTIGVKRRVLVQPTGIDLQKFDAVAEDRINLLRQEHAPNGERILISISRLGREKNIDFLLDAIALLKESKLPPFKLLILGDGPERNRIQGKINQLGLRSSISLLGSVPPERVPEYCRAGDLFLFASRSETQGMVILEAMASGMPVVAVRSSGIDDIVENGVNGFKTPPSKQQWCERIKQILDNEPLHKQLSENAKLTASNYSIKCFSEHVHQFYAQILTAARQLEK
ncbi:glycosyltransferase [Neopusillimonas maritima]|uniref:Glycosyl transferase family 1 n=1 Tax=Neopusillimonas maritima TaxID=2026239 RepID=A0ABX9MTV1_9BURK|nr:glycosyltransferase [Neopusillimonas maritima]RII82293.1 glycosyl transferase family 1 [Neopusillimonas maritima]